MNKLVLTAIVGAIAATACTQLREPTDSQLATLLRSERAAATDTNAQLDSNAIDCLRGWSGDADLLKGLAMRFAGEEGKAACRTQLDAWVADATRNPDKLTFGDVSAPKSVRQAIALQTARSAALIAHLGSQQIPGALTGGTAAVGVEAPRPPDPKVDLGAAGAQLSEAETLCQQVQQAGLAADAKDDLKAYGAYCAGTLRQLRITMEQVVRGGQNSQRLTSLATSASNMANIARKQLAGGSK